MTEPLRIAIAGLGTVGVGVVRNIQDNASLNALRAGRPVEIVAVSSRDRTVDRGVDCSGYKWVDNAVDLASMPDVDVVVELIGGSEGIAKDVVEKALENGKHVVTANKALLAHYGADLAALAEQKDVALGYEAAVAGGIPIIKTMKEGLSGNFIRSVYGILNGTCNYIPTVMRDTGEDFDKVLKDAQDAGYAEADPSLDIDGIDAGHKLSLLASLAFGVKPEFDNLPMRGIRDITARDIKYASELEYEIKLLGIASRRGDGRILQTVEPCLVPKSSQIAKVDDAYNAVFVRGNFVEEVMLQGKGAGQGPTASSVVSDVIDIARGQILPVFGVPVSALQNAQWASPEDCTSQFYMHVKVQDVIGAIQEISSVLAKSEISIAKFNQYDDVTPISIVIKTSMVEGSTVTQAKQKIQDLPFVQGNINVMRIEHV